MSFAKKPYKRDDILQKRHTLREMKTCSLDLPTWLQTKSRLDILISNSNLIWLFSAKHGKRDLQLPLLTCSAQKSPRSWMCYVNILRENVVREYVTQYDHTADFGKFLNEVTFDLNVLHNISIQLTFENFYDCSPARRQTVEIQKSALWSKSPWMLNRLLNTTIQLTLEKFWMRWLLSWMYYIMQPYSWLLRFSSIAHLRVDARQNLSKISLAILKSHLVAGCIT